jgi:crossover junction endodeoxyribonuclease RuvC
MQAGSRILGIDPGSVVTGFGIIEYHDKKWQCITAGCWKLDGQTFIQRLHSLQQSLDELLAQFKPNQAAIEDVFVHKNARGALKLGQARGVIIASLIRNALPVYEYAPKQVKQAVVGKGAAAKDQVQAMVKILLNLDMNLTLDASDALAIALTHGHVNTGLAAVLQSNQFARRSGRSKRSTRWLKNDWKNTR